MLTVCCVCLPPGLYGFKGLAPVHNTIPKLQGVCVCACVRACLCACMPVCVQERIVDNLIGKQVIVTLNSY